MNPWAQFESEFFEIIDLGREAIFYIPVNKLQGEEGELIRQDLHSFLMSRFGPYSASKIGSYVTYGYWINPSKETVYDESVIYNVAFVGKEKLPILLEKLAKLASEINEECIYVKAGQYSGLVRPKKASRS